jgi:Mor family transcriptional regulator
MKRVKYRPCKFCKLDVRTTQKKCPFCGKYLYSFIKERIDLDRNQEIVQLREEGKTLRELSDTYNISQERVRIIQRDFKDRKKITK